MNDNSEQEQTPADHADPSAPAATPGPASASEPDVVRATPQARLYLAGLIFLVLAVVSTFQFLVFPQLIDNLKQAANANAILGTKVAFACFIAIVLVAAAVVIWYGARIALKRQYPLPAAWVWRDTPVKRGGDAIRVALLHFLIGILMCIASGALTFFLWRGLERITPQYQMPSGVTIVQ